MKLFKEIKHILGLDDNNQRAWLNPEETGKTVRLADHHAADINAQFENTGIKLEEVPEKQESPIVDPNADEGTKKLSTSESLANNFLSNPEMQNGQGMKPEEVKDVTELADGQNHSTDGGNELSNTDEGNNSKEDLTLDEKNEQSEETVLEEYRMSNSEKQPEITNEPEHASNTPIIEEETTSGKTDSEKESIAGASETTENETTSSNQ